MSNEVTKILKTEEMTPEERRKRVQELRSNIDHSYFEIAKLLSEVRDNKDFKKYGYESFREYVEGEVTFAIRKAQRLIKIWETLKKVNDERIAKRFEKIGWSKSMMLTGIITPKNAEKLLEEAEKRPWGDLEVYVRKQRKGQEAGKIERMTFFPEGDQIEMIEEGLKRAASMMPKLPEGENYRGALVLAYALQAFVSGNTFPEKDGSKNFAVMIRKFEKLLGLRSIWWNPESKEILHGANHIKELAEAAKETK